MRTGTTLRSCGLSQYQTSVAPYMNFPSFLTRYIGDRIRQYHQVKQQVHGEVIREESSDNDDKISGTQKSRPALYTCRNLVIRMHPGAIVYEHTFHYLRCMGLVICALGELTLGYTERGKIGLGKSGARSIILIPPNL